MHLHFTVPAHVKKSFSDLGYCVHDVPFDGECAFAAIGHQLSTKNYVQDFLASDIVRRDVVRFLSNNEELKRTIAQRLVGQSIDNYVTDMLLKTTWADENILYVASIYYDVAIRIIRIDAATPVDIGTSSADRRIVLGYVSCVPGEQPTHYVSLLPNTGLMLLQGGLKIGTIFCTP